MGCGAVAWPELGPGSRGGNGGTISKPMVGRRAATQLNQVPSSSRGSIELCPWHCQQLRIISVVDEASSFRVRDGDQGVLQFQAEGGGRGERESCGP